MSRIYTCAADHINFHPYEVMTHPDYAPTLPSPYLSGEMAPIYVNPVPNLPVFARHPIKNLIDLYATRQSFELVRHIDVIRIFHALDAYLIEISDSIPINQQVKQYARKVLAFREACYKNFVRMLNLHPEWKEAYMGGVNKLLEILELFAAPDFSKMRQVFDRIEALRAPPVVLDAPVAAPAPFSESGMVPYAYA